MQEIKTEIEIFVSQAISKNASAIIFDPEEEFVFVYFLVNHQLFIIKKYPVENTEEINKTLTDYSNKQIKWGEQDINIFSYTALTNYGFRNIINLIPKDIMKDEIMTKNYKSEIVRDINRMIPPTSFTNRNVENLREMIRKRSKKKIEELKKIFEKNQMNNFEGLFTPDFDIKPNFPRKYTTSLIGEWMGIPYIDLEEIDINPISFSKFKKEDCQKFKALPFQIDNQSIKTAFFDPQDKKIIKEIEKISKYKVAPYISPEEDIKVVIEKKFKH